MSLEFETYGDLLQIIELQATKEYRMHPSFIECVFNGNNIHKDSMKPLPTNHHCMVYIYYNWRSALTVKYQSTNLGISNNYICKVNVFRIPPWINVEQKPQKDDDEQQINPNQVYAKLLETEINKAKAASKTKSKSPLSLFKRKSRKRDDDKKLKPSVAAFT